MFFSKQCKWTIKARAGKTTRAYMSACGVANWVFNMEDLPGIDPFIYCPKCGKKIALNITMADIRMLENITIFKGGK